MNDIRANPAPLGLMGFGMTTILLNLHNAGFFELDDAIVAMGIFYGGHGQLLLCQVIAIVVNIAWAVGVHRPEGGLGNSAMHPCVHLPALPPLPLLLPAACRRCRRLLPCSWRCCCLLAALG